MVSLPLFLCCLGVSSLAVVCHPEQHPLLGLNHGGGHATDCDRPVATAVLAVQNAFLYSSSHLLLKTCFIALDEVIFISKTLKAHWHKGIAGVCEVGPR